MRPNAFPRERRLKRRRLVRPLFERGRGDVGRVRVGVVQVLYRLVARADTGLDTPLQVGFAPGRRRTAVLRNRLRRLMRETFRLHQAPLVERFAARSDTLTLFVLFRGREATAGPDLRRDLPDALARLARRPFPPLEAAPADAPAPLPDEGPPVLPEAAPVGSPRERAAATGGPAGNPAPHAP